MKTEHEFNPKLRAELERFFQGFSSRHQLEDAIREALAGTDRAQTEFGCHCDLDPGMEPDGCVIDEHRLDDCVYARLLTKDGKSRDDCQYWKPIVFVKDAAS